LTLSQSRGSVNEVIASSAFLGDIPNWPYFPTLQRLVLALAIGLFVGIERERRRKEAGLRTFAFTALLGAVGAMLGTPYALAALGLVGMLVVLLNVDTIHAGEGAEITTSAALLVVAFAGLLAGQGHTFTPTVLGVATAALLAWKQPLAGFSHTLTEEELGSAILLAILTFVVYPLLPSGAVDPWDLVDPRRAWMTVILIAGLGFANYILLKVYGTRGMEVTGFLGGLVNSTVTVTELVTRARETSGWLADVAYRSILLATGAMVVRNAVILGLLAPVALLTSLVPLGFMLAGAMALAVWRPISSVARHAADADGPNELVLPALASPFSLTAAMRFGLLFLALQATGALAQRSLGSLGFYAVSLVGGLVSSASAVASAATLAASGTIPASVAGRGAILASLTSALVSLPLVARLAGAGRVRGQMLSSLSGVVLFGVLGVLVQVALAHAGVEDGGRFLETLRTFAWH
jgi:uncharacterized membrane protein (DUF4010 family)